MTSREKALSFVGRRLRWTGEGFTLITFGSRIGQNQTLWRPLRGKEVAGTVVEVDPDRFYQDRENVAWLTVQLDKPRGRFGFAKAYFDLTTGDFLNLGYERVKWER